jgi:hypothetical protein
MRISRNLVALVLLGMACGCIGHTTASLTEESGVAGGRFDPSHEEALIYRIVVAGDEDARERRVVLIHANTADHWTTTFLTKPDYIKYLHEPFHGFNASAVDDFLTRNQGNGTQANVAAIDPPAIIVTDSDLVDASVGGPGWPGLERKYPGSRGCFRLSRVGFSTDGDSALVYVAIGERGDLIGLQRTDSGWTISKRLNVWVA